MASSPVPVSWDRLGVHRAHNTKLLAHAVEQVAGDPQLVAGGDSYTWSNLRACDDVCLRVCRARGGGGGKVSMG